MRSCLPLNPRHSTLLFVHASADLYGSDITLLQLVSGLDQDRFHSIVVVPYDGPLVPRLKSVGAEVLLYPELPILRRQYMNIRGLFHLAIASFRSVFWLVGLIRAQEVALIHSNTLAVLTTGLAAKLARRPHIRHVHEIVVRPRLMALVLATLSSIFSTLVVANSKATADHYSRTRLIGSSRIRVIYNGVDESRLSLRPEVALRSLIEDIPEGVVFTLVGRINRWKGHSVFLDAAEQLVAELEEVRFLVVGDSFLGQEELTEALDRRIASSDVLRGRMVRLPHTTEIGSIYSVTDVVVVPSIVPESFGLVAAEAMAAGLPIIASRIGALSEVVKEGRTGILVDPGDHVSLSEAMAKLAASPDLRARMGREGRRRFERRFRVERYVAEFSRTYDELLSDN